MVHNTFVLEAWTWWRQSNNIANHELACILVMLALLLPVVLTISRCARRGDPPLPPGPLGLPLVGSLPFLDPELHTYFASLARTYGPIFTLWLGNKVSIVITSPAMAREVLRDHDATFANRPVVSIATKESPLGGVDIVWTPYGPEWRMLRRVCVQKLLSNATLDSFYTLRRSEVRRTVRDFYHQVGLPVKFGEQIFPIFLNVITNMLWGGTVTGKEKAELGAEFGENIRQMFDILAKPNISDFVPTLTRFDLQGIQKQMKVNAQWFDQIFNTLNDQHIKMDREGKSKESKDFFQFLLQLRDEDDAKMPLTMSHIKALLVDMVVGGTDTTASTVEFTMTELMNKPEVMRNVQQELDTVVGEDNTVEESHIHKLPYLHAVMKEVLRLHPPVPLMVPHCPSETCMVGGYTIPKGARVFVNVWAIHRDPSVWESPSEFVPERFLNGKWDYSGNDFSYIPFGSGRRICAGITMAERMFMFLVASLLHSFDWKLPEGEKLDFSEKFGIVVKKKVPLVAIPTPRLSDTSLYQ
ncbi:flavonoid 3'-monooxygenase CYP75B137-like [Cornus florida]|uniref:flavonoid 3'-monooxygenase CYP75B137-like n=1 Tax=Cornus florida TaxID=4283 RepID=UPI00289EC56F|nr:flavonoid 3'-monooxygenase CYP75B137-like [Cornus florida]